MSKITREELQTKFAVVTNNDKAARVNESQFKEVILMICNERNIDDFEQSQFDNMVATYFQSIQKNGVANVEDLYKSLKKGMKKHFGPELTIWDVICGLTFEFQASRKGRELRQKRSIMTAQDLVGGGNQNHPNKSSDLSSNLLSIEESSPVVNNNSNQNNSKQSRSNGRNRGDKSPIGRNRKGLNSSNSSKSSKMSNKSEHSSHHNNSSSSRRDYIEDDPLKAGSIGLAKYGRGTGGPGTSNLSANSSDRAGSAKNNGKGRGFGRKYSYGKITRVFTKNRTATSPSEGARHVVSSAGGAAGDAGGSGDSASNEDILDALKRQEAMLYRVYSQVSFLEEQIRGKYAYNDDILNGIKNIEYLKSTLQSVLGMSLSALKDDLLDLFESSSMTSAAQVALGINGQLSRMNGTLRWASDLLSRNSIEEFNGGISKLEDLVGELTLESKSFFGNAMQNDEDGADGADGNGNELILDMSPIMKELEAVKHSVSTLDYYLNDNILQRLEKMEQTVMNLFGKILPAPGMEDAEAARNKYQMIPRDELNEQLDSQRNNFERQIKQQKLKIQELQKALDLQKQLSLNERKEIDKERERLRGSIVRVSQQEAVIAELRTELKKRLAKVLFSKNYAPKRIKSSETRDNDSDDANDESEDGSDSDLDIVSTGKKSKKSNGTKDSKSKSSSKSKSKSFKNNESDSKTSEDVVMNEEDDEELLKNTHFETEFDSIESAYNYIMQSGYSIIYGKGTLKELKQIETIINSRVAERRTRKFEAFLTDRVVNEKDKIDKKDHFSAWQDEINNMEIEGDELPDFLQTTDNKDNVSNNKKNAIGPSDIELEHKLGFGWQELLKVYRENTYLKTKLAFNEMEKNHIRSMLDDLSQPIVIGANIKEAEMDILKRIEILKDTFKDRLVDLRDLNFSKEVVRKQMAYIDKYRLQIYRDLKKDEHARKKQLIKERYNINKDRSILKELISKWKHEIPKEKEEIIKMKDELSKTMRAYTKKLHETTILKKEFEAKKEMSQNEITNEMINERVNKHIETYKAKIQGSIRAESEAKHKKEINRIKSEYNEKLSLEMSDINDEWKSQITKFQNIIQRYKDEQSEYLKQLDRTRSDMEDSEKRAANAIRERSVWEGKYQELKKNFDENEKKTDELYNEIQKIQEAWRNEQRKQHPANQKNALTPNASGSNFGIREVRSGSKVIVQGTRLRKHASKNESSSTNQLRHQVDTLTNAYKKMEQRSKKYESMIEELQARLGKTTKDYEFVKERNIELEKEIEEGRNELSALNDKLVGFDALKQVSEQALEDIKKLHKSKHERLIQEENQLRWDFTTWYAHKNHCLRKYFFMIEEWFMQVFWRHERTVAHYASGSFMEAQLNQILRDTWLEVRIQSHCFTRWFGQLSEEKEKELFYAKDYGNEERYVWKKDIRKFVAKQRPGLIDRYYKQEINEREQRRYDYWQRHPDAFILFEFVNRIYAEKHLLTLEEMATDINYMRNTKLSRITLKNQNTAEYKAIVKKNKEKEDYLNKKAQTQRHKTNIKVNDIVSNDPLSLPDEKIKQRVVEETEKRRRREEKKQEKEREREKEKERHRSSDRSASKGKK